MLLAWFIVSSMEHFLEGCIGFDIPAPQRRDYVGFVLRLGAAVPCSPRLLGGPLMHWVLFVGMWGPVPFAVTNFFWTKRHAAYWDDVRAREKAKRAEKRAAKAVQAAASEEQV
jgi:hypothetical protein